MTVDDECEYSSLPKIACGHCLGAGPVTNNGVKVGPTFKARYDGWCVGCRSEIERDDLIMYVDDVAVHAACAEEVA